MADSEITVDVAVTRTPVEDPDPAPMMETLVEAPACEIPPSPLDFDVMTLSELGISTQSFLPSSNRKNKSRLAQLKQRRRSSVGVRGSPETNSLIRYQAQQRMKTPPTTPESFRASPSLPRFSSTLKQKMASFQSLVDVKENVMLGTSPSRQDNLIGQCIKTRDYLSDGRSQDCRKENSDPENAPPIKRRCTTPIEECAEEIRGVNAPILKHTPLKPHKVAVLQDRVWLTKPLTPRAQSENQPAHTVFLSPSQPAGGQVLVYESQPSSLTHCTPTKTQQESLFEVQSPSQAQANGSLPGRPADRDVFVMPSLPALNPTDCGDRPGNSTAKKRVRFGAPLSPEYFDRTLPPSTPLHKGSTPAAAAATSTAGSQLRSLLKTPQRSELPSTPATSDFTSPCLTGGSPLLSTGPDGGIVLGAEGDDTYTLGKIAFPTLEDTDSPLVDNTAAEVNLEIQALDLNAAFQEDSVSEALLEDPAPETESVSEPALEPGPPSEPEDAGTTALEPGPPSELEDVGTTALEHGPPSELEDVGTTDLEPGPPSEPEDAGTTAPASGSKNKKRKRKPTDKEQTVRRSTRAAVSGKMKKPSEKRAWSKKVNLLLYPSREYASKSPALSPVTETLSKSPALSPVTETLHGPSRTPTTDHRRTRRRTAEEEDPTNDTSAHTLGTADTSVMDPCGGASGSRPRTPAVRGGRRKVSVPADDWLSEGSEKTEDQTTAIPEDQTTAVPEDQTTAVPEVPESGPSNLGTTDTFASDSCDGASEAPVDHSTDTPGRATRSGRTPSRSGPKTLVDKIQGRGRRRKVTVPSDDCLSKEPEQSEDQTTTTNPEVPVSGPSEHTEAPAEQDTIRVADGLTTFCPSSDVDITVERAENDTAQANELPTGEEEVGVGGQQHTASREEEDNGLHHSEESDPSLPPWQRGDFNIDDVLRPAANSRKNPVRRSLRNQASREDGNSSGLAWLPHTSPESLRAVRRRSRGLHRTGKRPQKS